MHYQKINGITTRRSNWSAQSKLTSLSARSSNRFNSPTSIRNRSPRNNKTNCAFHPNEKITNFCKKVQCLLPLCPKCVQIHSDEHQNMGVFGSFSTIEEVTEQTQNFLQTSYLKIDDFSKMVTEKKEQFEDYMTSEQNKLNELRQYLHEEVDNMIDSCQSSWVEQTTQRNKEVLQALQLSSELINQLGEQMQFMVRRMGSSNGVIEAVINYFSSVQKLTHLNQAVQNLAKKEFDLSSFQFTFQQVSGIVAQIEDVVSLKQQAPLRIQKCKENAEKKSFTQLYLCSNEDASQKEVKIKEFQTPQLDKISRDYQSIGKRMTFQNFISPLDKFSLKNNRKQKII